MESFIMTESKGKPPYWEMGQRIIKARETLTNMSQSDMTRTLGLREPTYGNYERGTRKMPPDVMKAFYILTGCSADYIYRGEGPMKTGGEDPQKEKLWAAYREIDPADHDALWRVIEGLKKK